VEARTQCPPEEWFCDDDAPPGEPEPTDPEQPDGAEEPSEWTPTAPAEPPPADLAGRGKIDLDTAAVDGATEPSEMGPSSPWSVSLRLQGVALGAGDRDAGLGGIGVSLRYFFLPGLALDLGLDSFGGTDYNGYDRSEGSLSLSTLLFLNPEQQIRTYMLLGFHLSGARVDVAGEGQDWSYAGGQAGLGLEFMLGPGAALGVDMLGFLRGRTDERAAREPEFTDDFGNMTNLSGGGVFRGFVSLYW
jgi:hypothetical protein